MTIQSLEFHITYRRVSDGQQIECLLNRTFGPNRMERTSYRLRDGVPPIADLDFVALGDADKPLASLRFWPVTVAGQAAILLGPLAVEPRLQGQGMGRALVAHGLKEAKRLGHRLCLVVGDPSYYRPYGFAPASPHGLVLPGPVEPERFQLLELVPGAVEGLRGPVERVVRTAGTCEAGTIVA